MDSKKWWQSKAIWAGLVAILVAVYNATLVALAAGCETDPIGICVILPAIPEWVYAILGALGVYGRAKASSKIS